MAESLEINIEHETKSNESRTDHFSRKVASLESVLLVTNFVLELPSAVFDQLSSVHKPQFALLSMLMSFAVFIISVIDLVNKRRQEKVSLMKKGFIMWFHYPNFEPFGTFPDIIGFVFALFQRIFAAIAYSFVSRNADNPIKVSTLPIGITHITGPYPKAQAHPSTPFPLFPYTLYLQDPHLGRCLSSYGAGHRCPDLEETSFTIWCIWCGERGGS